MKNLLFILLFFCSNFLLAQEWITDDDFESKINGKNPYGESYTIVIVEFYADFNKDNQFKDWEKLEGVKYYKCDIKKSPKAKKSFKVRMAPTIIVFAEGVEYKDYRAGLDLICPIDLLELQEAVTKANTY
jgi:hypothetical protein